MMDDRRREVDICIKNPAPIIEKRPIGRLLNAINLMGSKPNTSRKRYFRL
jgi:hypothetical protein